MDPGSGSPSTFFFTVKLLVARVYLLVTVTGVVVFSVITAGPLTFTSSTALSTAPRADASSSVTVHDAPTGISGDFTVLSPLTFSSPLATSAPSLVQT